MNTVIKIMNLIFFNLLGGSVTLWLVSFMNAWSYTLAICTGTSLLIINILKIRGMLIDQRNKKLDEKSKKKELKKK